jgi:hypothetical protein
MTAQATATIAASAAISSSTRSGRSFGGVFGCSWVNPVRAFTDHCKASVCRYIREQRREKPRDGVSRPIDYIGSCVKRIEVVIDE